MKDEEKLIEGNENENDLIRESNVKMERIIDNTLEKIENLKEGEESGTKKLSSIQIVFSVWNTMIYYTGIIPTILIGFLYGFICYLNCSVVVRLGGKEEEFFKVVYNYFFYGFGPRAAKVGIILQITFNLMINIGATFIYFLIINQNLYPCICLFLKLFNLDIDGEDITPYFDKFSLFYCALLVSLIVFPLTILKEMHILAKFNSFGIYFVSALLIFVIYTGIRTLCTDTFHFEYKENIEGSKDRNLFLFGTNPGIITGTFSIGMFCHSVILPLMKNNKKPENNQRDLFFGYVCVTLTYIIIGIMGYIGFSGSDYSSEFKQNWFIFFKSDNYFILVLRILNVVQLTSIFQILFFVVRKQLFETFFQPDYKSKLSYIIFSCSLL